MNAPPSADDPAPGVAQLGLSTALALIVVLAAGLFAVSYLAPANLADDYHQERAASYVMDALLNGNWICQYGAYGEVSSKPPLFTWLAALVSLPFGRATWFTLLLPGALATLGISLLLLWSGRQSFGWRAGFLAALIYLASPLGLRQIALARIDGLFSFTVALTALAGFVAWQERKSWIWFWLAAAAATLTKGPLGLLLGSLGLLAVFWERRTGQQLPGAARSHVPGILLFVVLTAGWFYASYRVIGEPLIKTMVGFELVNSVVEVERKRFPLQEFYKPTAYVLRNFLPWALLTFVALWRIWKSPAADDRERRFERFVFCWFSGGLLCFSVSAHQRPDLVFPLIPPAALLAGRELARWAGRFSPRRLLGMASGLAALIVVVAGMKTHVLDARKPIEQRTAALQTLADQVAAKVGSAFPLTHLDSPYAFQFYLNTKRTYVSAREAAALLKSDAAAYVAVANFEALRKELGAFTNVHTLAHWSRGPEEFRIVSNRPRLAWNESMVFSVPPARFHLRGVGAVATRGRTVTLSPSAGARAWVRVELIASQGDHVVQREGRLGPPEERRLRTGEAWEIEFTDPVRLSLRPAPLRRAP